MSSGGGGVPVTVSVVRFLSSLPDDDTSIATWAELCSTSCTAANAVAARFVEVRVQPVTMPTICRFRLSLVEIPIRTPRVPRRSPATTG